MLAKLKDRYTVVSIVFALIGVIIIYQLVSLQVINGKEYDDQAQRRLLNERRVVAPRGNIIDKNGVPIAVNRLGFTVQIAKTKLKDNELNEMLLKLVNIFEKNGDSYSRSIGKYLTIAPFAYGPSIKDSQAKIDKWKKEMALQEEDIEKMSTPEAVFEYMRSKFNIDKKYTVEEAYRIMTVRYEILIRGYTKLNPLYIAKDVNKLSVAEIEEKHDQFPGVTTNVEPMRRYVDAQMEAHVVGYVAGLSPEEYKNLKDEGYNMNDIIGKNGIEQQAEKYLKGKDGIKTVEEDIWGKQTGELGGKPAEPGNDVVLTLDTKLQKVAMESLQRQIDKIRQGAEKGNLHDANAGAAVAIDVNSGEVLALASYPSYDPSVFLEGADNKDAQKYIMDLFDPKNEDKPAYNRAIQGLYIPGSTYKPLTAVAGLEEGIITPQKVIYDSGRVNIGGWDFTCLEYRNGQGAHGPLQLEKALATSCNIYFHILGRDTTIDKMDKWGKLFGLGELTGIDLPNEMKGNRANKEFKKKAWNDDWRPADTAQSAIGQQFHFYTPLQLANYVATLSNGGKKYKPHLIKRVIKYDGSVVMETTPEYEQIPVKPETLAAVKQGMVAVANSVEGTAASAFQGFPFQVAGKTGTPETGNEAKHSSNALFVCYAPADNPQIAVAVVVERGVWGSNAAPIARDILTEYFGVNKKNVQDDKIKDDEAVLTR